MDALKKISQAGFDVALVGDGIEISPASALTQQHREFIKQHKADIVDELNAEQRILLWLAHIDEDDPEIIDDVMTRCREVEDARDYFLKRAGEIQ